MLPAMGDAEIWLPRPYSLTHVLPCAGFSNPTTLTVLPQALTGTSTGTWAALPLATPGLLLSLGAALAGAAMDNKAPTVAANMAVIRIFLPIVVLLLLSRIGAKLVSES